MSTVSIATKPLVYGAFRHIANKAHFALSEYVDNSISSFEQNKDVLSKINPDGQVCVDINIDDNQITIVDNAFGIDSLHYEKAFELAELPLDNTGLNEFGMGMKISSIWLSNEWTVETSAYGEPVKKTITFNVDNVAKESLTELDVIEELCDINKHYTKVTLRKLTVNAPKSGQISKIKKHLASTYSRFISKGIAKIKINGEPLIYQQPTVLNAPYFKSPESSSILWKREINFEAGPYKAKGFIALLDKMSSNAENGFLLFRRNRTIGTSAEDKYRPSVLCGTSGSPKYKRIFGELDIEGFGVSFTKNAFSNEEDLEAFMKMIADDLRLAARRENFDFFGQADSYRAPEKKVEKSVKILNLERALTQSLSSSQTPPSQTISVPVEPKQNPAEGVKQHPEKLVLTAEQTKHTVKPEPGKVTLSIDGKSYNVIIKFSDDKNTNGLYQLEKNIVGEYIATVSTQNQFFDQFNELFKHEEGLRAIASFIRAMVGSEISLINAGESTGSFFRQKFNELFGIL